MARYPRLQKTQKMLDVLDRTIREAEQHGDPEVQVSLSRGGLGDAQLELSYFPRDESNSRKVNLVEELGLGGGETVGLFRWAESEGYISPDYGGGNRNAELVLASLDHLEGKGYELIGELPNPQERLALVLESAIRVVRSDQSLAPEERQRRIDWFEEAKFVVRTFGVEAAKAVLRGDLPPM